MKSTIKKLACIFTIILSCLSSHAQKVFDFNATCQQAYHDITSLKLTSGELLVKQERQRNPNNLIPEMLESYIDFYTLFFNEDPTEYKNRKSHFDDYLDKLDDGPESSPFYNYCKSTVYLQKACVQIKFGERFSAGWNFRKAFGLIKDNRKQFPTFMPNNIIYGPAVVAAGIIPDGYKWLASIFGIKGSVKDGVTIMQNFVNSNDPWAKLFFDEACFYYCYVVFYVENKPDEAFNFISQRKLDLVNNHLLAYMAANLALNNKQNEVAKNIILNRNPGAEYMKTSIWDFEMGYIKMRHLELPDAIQYFTSYLANFKGKFYVKDACEKLYWCYYLQGNNSAAENTRQRILKAGNTDTDADKQANRDAKTGIYPNPLLLKARVLSDGGYNNEALGILLGKNSNDFPKIEDKLEFVYRLARIYDDLARYDDAIKAYNFTINLGEHRQEYYAARSALQLGLIYEKLGKKNLAIGCYQKCLDMDDHEYKDSLDQKAKAGLARCKGQ